MMFFPSAHASGPDWMENVDQVVLQLRAQLSMQPNLQMPRLGVLYVSAGLVSFARDIMERVAQGLPGVAHWSGGAGGTLLGGDLTYGETPAIGAMLLAIPDEDFYVFSGVNPLSRAPQGFVPEVALVHGSLNLPDQDELLQELGSSMRSGLLMGGLSVVQFARSSHGPAMPAAVGSNGMLMGGLSGVALRAGAGLRLTYLQACRPVGAALEVTRAEDNIVLELQGRPAMDAMLETLGLGSTLPPPAFAAVVHETWIAQSQQPSDLGGAQLPAQLPLTRLSGLDVVRRALVMPKAVKQPLYVRFAHRDAQTAQNDMRRAGAQIMEELTADMHAPDSAGSELKDTSMGSNVGSGTRSVAGVLLVRSAPQSLDAITRLSLDADLQLLRHALGPVPLIGWELEQTVSSLGVQTIGGQLLVFTRPLQML